MRQGGWVLLEQSHICLALKVAKMAKGEFPCTAIAETQQLIQNPSTEFREMKKRGVEFPWHKEVKAATERHPAMVYENHTAGFFPC
jgi:hypothetical protein